MNKNRIAMMAACGAMLLAGCSTDGAETSTSPTTAAEDAVIGSVPTTGDAPTDREGRGGLTGEIAYVGDGVAQVQDGSTQTAVTFGSDTTFTQEVALTLADIAVGSCIVATLGDDDAATAVTVSEADEDGSCATGLGGAFSGGGFPGGDGDMPTDMPTAMPDGMELPDGAELPDGMELPDGAELPDRGDGGFAFAGVTAGTVTAVSGGTLTVEDADGAESTVSVADDATVTGRADADADAVEVGMCLTATGEADDAGGYVASTVYVFDGGDEGCVSFSGFGGRGGMGGAPGGGSSEVGEPALESGQ
ncbi:hypothetical protein [Demequina iriomotensis]|uniref:hypothetical protein n=1 Tax=Demequina iriomotensis TaxID=1536641 RepID=UPI000AE1334A|nr:hypothetical protein [Demequina iriomotensis]